MRKLFQTIKRGPFEGWRGYFKSLWNDKEGMFWAVLLIAAWVLYGVYGCRAGDSTAPSDRPLPVDSVLTGGIGGPK